MSAKAEDPFNLQRFLDAQSGIYASALAELRAGRKRTHWMWFIFPQIAGLGTSATAERYAIRSREEAAAYLSHEMLGPRLRECAETLLNVEAGSAERIFGYPDYVKLKSSMTLFGQVAEPLSHFAAVLDKYFGGEPDHRTLLLTF